MRSWKGSDLFQKSRKRTTPCGRLVPPLRPGPPGPPPSWANSTATVNFPQMPQRKLCARDLTRRVRHAPSPLTFRIRRLVGPKANLVGPKATWFSENGGLLLTHWGKTEAGGLGSEYEPINRRKA